MKEKQKNKLPVQTAQKIDNAATDVLASMTVGSLAKESNVSKRHLLRVFKADYNCCLKDYLEKAKINKAAELLEITDLPVKEIASRLDYSKPGYFSEVFKKLKGVSPGKYREYHKTQSEKNEQIDHTPNNEPANPDEYQPQNKTGSRWKIFKNKIISYFQTKINY